MLVLETRLGMVITCLIKNPPLLQWLIRHRPATQPAAETAGQRRSLDIEGDREEGEAIGEPTDAAHGYDSIRPPIAIHSSITNLLGLVGAIPTGATDEEILGQVQLHRWSAFNIPMLWAAAGDNETTALLDWMEQ